MRLSVSARAAMLRAEPLLGRFLEARSGLAALEFALILPAMLVLYVGGVEVNDAVSVKRKLNHSSSAIADLAGQSSATLTSANVDDIVKAGNAILEPYDTTLLKTAVVGVAIDADKKATVAWAKAYNGAACPAKGSAVTVPANLATANGFLVMVDASYAFTPKIGYVLTGTFDLSDRIFQQPRIGKAVSGPSC